MVNLLASRDGYKKKKEEKSRPRITKRREETGERKGEYVDCVESLKGTAKDIGDVD